MRKAAIFDFDGTMRKGDSIVPFLRYAFLKGYLPLGSYFVTGIWALLYLIHLIHDDLLKSRALKFERKLTLLQRQSLEEGFTKEVLIPTLYENALQEWEKRGQEGCTRILLSASTENYMRCVAEQLHADALLCTPVDKDYTVHHNCKGAEKARRLMDAFAKDPVDLASSCAYGDSNSDWAVLKLVGRAYAVNPKKKLRRQAEKNGTPILHWQ